MPDEIVHGLTAVPAVGFRYGRYFPPSTFLLDTAKYTKIFHDNSLFFQETNIIQHTTEKWHVYIKFLQAFKNKNSLHPEPFQWFPGWSFLYDDETHGCGLFQDVSAPIHSARGLSECFDEDVNHMLSPSHLSCTANFLQTWFSVKTIPETFSLISRRGWNSKIKQH